MNFAFATTLLVIMYVGDYVLEWPTAPGQPSAVPDMYYIVYVALLAVLLQLKHVQCCGRLLLTRFNLCLAQSSMKVDGSMSRYLDSVNALDAIWRLKNEYQKIFGSVVVLSLSMDLSLFIAIVFMGVNSVHIELSSGSAAILTMCIGYGIFPYVKNCVVLCTIDGFGDMVDKL